MKSQEAIERLTACLPVGAGRWYLDAVAQLEAEVQALADMRALDDWARSGTEREPRRLRIEPEAIGLDQWEQRKCSGKWLAVVDFDGPTPDAARHAAAEWVRGQKRVR